LGIQAEPTRKIAGDFTMLKTSTRGDVAESVIFEGRLDLKSYHVITDDWLRPVNNRPFKLSLRTNATSIVIVETDYIFEILLQQGICEKYNCILVTWDGMSALSTRACVYSLHHRLKLTVRMYCDCDKKGLDLFQTFAMGCNNGIMVDRREYRYSIPTLYWLGLYPTQVEYLSNPDNFIDEPYTLMSGRDKCVPSDDNKRGLFNIYKSTFVTEYPRRVKQLQLLRYIQEH
jgi:hypothetical protein